MYRTIRGHTKHKCKTAKEKNLPRRIKEHARPNLSGAIPATSSSLHYDWEEEDRLEPNEDMYIGDHCDTDQTTLVWLKESMKEWLADKEALDVLGG
jgi:hypothetical protein